MKFALFFILNLLSAGLCVAQVGINTQNPQATLDIISGGNTASTKALSVKNNLGADIFTIQDNGYTGLSVANPSVLLDLRDGQNNSIIGIGGTSQTPSEVGVGVLRYDQVYRSLDLSEGTQWKQLSANHEKVHVVANLVSTTQIFSQNRTATIINWSELSDETNSFNAATGIFTAPHGGNFTTSISMTLKDVASYSNNFNAYIVLSLIASSGETVKSLSSYNTEGSTLIKTPSISCTGSFSLTAGQYLRADLYNYLGSDASQLNSYLSIIEN